MTPSKQRRLVIVGDHAIAEVAFEYFSSDSSYEVVAFSVERDYLHRRELFGLPVIAFEEIEASYPPSDFDAFIAVGYGQLNRLRARLFNSAKAKRYRLASYISSKASVWPNVTVGENTFIFEMNVLQPFVTIGDDVVLWSGNHIGHHAKICNHVFVSSHVVVSGFVEIGDYSFVGVNATIADNVHVGRDCLIGAAAVVLKDLPAAALLATEQTKTHAISTLRRFGIKEP